jgi:hypothetical protein
VKILLLCNYELANAAMVSDHINSFYLYSSHEITIFSNLTKLKGNLPEDINLDFFDGIVVHYSLFLAVDAYVSTKTRQLLKKFTGIKAIFLQDEYRFVETTIRQINSIGFNIIFTCVPPESIEKVYPKAQLPNVSRVNVLTGYVPSSLLTYPPIPLEKRKYHVSYRGRKYPYWHGRLGLEKWVIAKIFKKDSKKFRLKTNISYKEKDRLYGVEWTNLLRNSRAVLGVESGASIFDFSGLISAKVDTISALLTTKKINYNDIKNKYFCQEEDTIKLAQISPRVFEAMALRTLCILYEGEYSGIIIPWRHYLPLKKDHSNMAEIVDILLDNNSVAEIIANAYAEVALNPKYSYAHFIEEFDIHMNEEASRLSLSFTNSEEINQQISIIKQNHPFSCEVNPHVWSNAYPGKSLLKPIIKKARSSSWIKKIVK